MTIRAVVNQKGGVGKTTTVVTLAGLMQLEGRRQLVVDLDPHASLTSYFRFDPDVVSGGVYRLFRDTTEGRELDAWQEILPVEDVGIDLLPASQALATVERRHGNAPGMGRVLARALKPLAQEYDDIWIDCSPTLGVLMVNALAASEQTLLPVQTEFLALRGLERMIDTLRMIERSRGTPIPRLIVPTLFDRRTRASLDAFYQLQGRYRGCLWPRPIPVDTRFRNASAAGLPLSHMGQPSRGVLAYGELVQHLLYGQRAGAAAQSDTH
jgi:chromosome partitioning protein